LLADYLICHEETVYVCGQENELKMLNDAYRSGKGKFVVLYVGSASPEFSGPLSIGNIRLRSNIASTILGYGLILSSMKINRKLYEII